MSNSEHLKLVRIICVCCGYWPVSLIKNDRIRYFYGIYHNFIYFYACFFTCCQIAELYRLVSEKDYSGIPNNIGYIMVFIECLVKMRVSRGRIFKNITQDLAELENKSLKQSTHPKQTQLHHNLVGYLNTITKAFLIFGNLTILLLVISPKFYKESDLMEYQNFTLKTKHTYVFRAWIPLNDDKHSSIIYMTHVVAAYCAFFAHASSDFIIVAFMIFCIQQLRILRDKIYRFRETALTNTDKSIDLDVAMVVEIRQWIEDHQTLIQ